MTLKMLKKILFKNKCRHVWRYLESRKTHSINYIHIIEKYGCLNCGKIKSIDESDSEVWMFKQEYKGNTFE